MNSRYYSKNKNFRTKPLAIFLFCIIAIVIPGLILWLFFGYINFSNAYLVFPAYGQIAHGTRKEILDHLQDIINNEHIANSFKEQVTIFYEAILKNTNGNILPTGNNTGKLYFISMQKSYYSALLAAVIIPYFVYSIILPLCLKPTKLLNYDTISFSVTCSSLFIMLLITAGIPIGHISNDNFVNDTSWIILARIVIVILSLPIFFFSSDRIVLLILSKSKNSAEYFSALGHENKEVLDKEKELKQEIYKKRAQRKEKAFIEINQNRVNYKKKKEK